MLHWHRFKILAVVGLCSVALEFSWLTTVWIRRMSNRKEGRFIYSFLMYFNELAFLLLFPLSVWLIEKKGPKASVVVGMILTAIGMWMMAVTNNSVAVGEILIGCAQPFVINTFTKWSAAWFGPKGRSIATMFLLVSIFLPLAFTDVGITSVEQIV